MEDFIKRVISKNENGHIKNISDYDVKGNEIHYKDSTGFEKWIDYNENGKQIHSKNSYGDESWREYDEKGNEIHFKNYYVEYWNEFDDKNNEIHSISSRGYEDWIEYDEKGNQIHHKDSNGNTKQTLYIPKSLYLENIKQETINSFIEYIKKNSNQNILEVSGEILKKYSKEQKEYISDFLKSKGADSLINLEKVLTDLTKDKKQNKTKSNSKENDYERGM